MAAPDYAAAKDVARANREFYRAFEARDLAAMRRVWLADEAVRCVHPAGEILCGSERVMASWQAIFACTPPLRFEISDLSIHVAGEMAWVMNVERIRAASGGEAEADGAELSVTAATNLFVRRDGAWRMLLHHASPVQRRFFRE